MAAGADVRLPDDAAGGSAAWDAAWDTSTRTGSVAVADASGAPPLERAVAGARAHASDLLPTLAQLCSERALDPQRPAHVFVGLGPGSYTGLRVGIATALGFGRGAECPVRGVPSYDAIVFDQLAPGERAIVLGDARRGTAYCGHYERTQDDVLELDPLRLMQLSELEAYLPTGTRILAEEGLLAESARCEPLPLPRASCLLALGRQRSANAAPDPALEPLYLRPWSSG